MLKIIRIFISIIAMAIAIYGLITSNSAMLPYMMGLLGILSLIWGITEIRNHRKTSGIICFILSALVLFDIIRTTIFR